jgi:hypothetical protein
MAQFRKNFLPSQSQPWAREVQDRLAGIESTFRSAEVNNRSRDEQLLASYNRLDKAFIQVAAATSQAAAAAATAQSAADAAAAAAATANGIINRIYVSGTEDINGATIGDGTISVDKIIAGTLTGFTIQTALSGRRVILSGTNASFYDEAGNFTGSISGSGDDRASSVQIISSSATALYVYNGGADLVGPGSELSVGDAGSQRIRLQANSGVQIIGGLQVGVTTITGAVTLSSTFSTSSSITRTQLAGGGVTGASFTDTGALVRTTSSARYKTEIEDINFQLSDILNLNPKTFKIKEEVNLQGESARLYAGFIAEDLAGTGLDVFVSYRPNEDGVREPDGIQYGELSAALVCAIKNLNERLERIEGANE